MGTVIREMARAKLLQAIACAVLALAVLHPVTRADQAAMLQDAEADLVVQLDVVGAPAGNALVLKTTATLKSLTAKLAKVTVVSRDKSQKTDAKVKAAQVALEQAQFDVRKVGATQKAAKAMLTKEKGALAKAITGDAKAKGVQAAAKMKEVASQQKYKAASAGFVKLATKERTARKARRALAKTVNHDAGAESAATGNKMNSATAVGQAKFVTHAAVAKEKDAIKEVKTIKVDVAKEKGYQGKVTKALADAGKVKDKFQKKLKVGYAKADVKRQTEEMKALTAQLKVKSADAKSDKAALVKDKASQKKSQAGAKAKKVIATAAKKKLGAADKKLAALTKKVKNINTLVRKAGTVSSKSSTILLQDQRNSQNAQATFKHTAAVLKREKVAHTLATKDAAAAAKAAAKAKAAATLKKAARDQAKKEAALQAKKEKMDVSALTKKVAAAQKAQVNAIKAANTARAKKNQKAAAKQKMESSDLGTSQLEWQQLAQPVL